MKDKVIHVRIDKEFKDKIKHRAEIDQMNVSEFIVFCIEQYLEADSFELEPHLIGSPEIKHHFNQLFNDTTNSTEMPKIDYEQLNKDMIANFDLHFKPTETKERVCSDEKCWDNTNNDISLNDVREVLESDLEISTKVSILKKII